MLSKAQIKYIRSLTLQKFRNEFKVFIAEGEKISQEWLLSGWPIQMIVATAKWAEQNQAGITKHPEAELHLVKNTELDALSILKTPNEVMLVAHMPQPESIPALNGWRLALEDIRDPGNMGTIIRIADWFGIRDVICAPGCVDIYNPKVVQSAMGSHLRVKVFEAELLPFLQSVSLPKLAATLDGQSVYEMNRMDACVLIIGNESKGLSQHIIAAATKQVTIPRRGEAESLNAAVSAGILCALLLPC